MWLQFPAPASRSPSEVVLQLFEVMKMSKSLAALPQSSVTSIVPEEPDDTGCATAASDGTEPDCVPITWRPTGSGPVEFPPHAARAATAKRAAARRPDALPRPAAVALPFMSNSPPFEYVRHRRAKGGGVSRG